jgi:hypothetical protein
LTRETPEQAGTQQLPSDKDDKEKGTQYWEWPTDLDSHGDKNGDTRKIVGVPIQRGSVSWQQQKVHDNRTGCGAKQPWPCAAVPCAEHDGRREKQKSGTAAEPSVRRQPQEEGQRYCQ